MKTILSSKGQFMVPPELRQRLGLEPGDVCEVAVEGDRLVLTPNKDRPAEFRIDNEATTGLPVIVTDDDAPLLTSAQVAGFLSDFP